MRAILRVTVAAIVLAPSLLYCQDHPTVPPRQDAIVYREPFTLRLKVDSKHYYEEHYDRRIPYVADNDVYLFSGEKFGVKFTADGSNFSVSYETDTKNADVSFAFDQPKQLGPSAMMLTIQSKLKSRLCMDALMTVPGKKDIYKTSILPIEAGLSDYESWPHPIVQLVLRNFRVCERPADAPAH